jgi:hypothetical protein
MNDLKENINEFYNEGLSFFDVFIITSGLENR